MSIDLYDAMSTLRAVRRLRPDPIPDDVLERVLQAACWAPTGGNQQPWKVVAKEALSDREWSHSRLDASQKRWPAATRSNPSATASPRVPADERLTSPAPVWQPEFNSKHRYHKFHWVRDTSPLLLADLARTNDLPSARQWLEPLPWAARPSPAGRSSHRRS